MDSGATNATTISKIAFKAATGISAIPSKVQPILNSADGESAGGAHSAALLPGEESHRAVVEPTSGKNAALGVSSVAQ